MSRALRRTLPAVLTALLVSLALAACAPSVAGSYKVYSINSMSAAQYLTAEAEANGLSLDEFFGTFAHEGFSGDPDEYMTLRLGTDGSAAVSVLGLERAGSYVREGGGVVITLENGEVLALEYLKNIGGLMYVQDENTRIVFSSAG